MAPGIYPCENSSPSRTSMSRRAYAGSWASATVSSRTTPRAAASISREVVIGRSYSGAAKPLARVIISSDMTMPLSALLTAANVDPVRTVAGDPTVSRVVYDSRAVQPGDLYVAVPGFHV